MRTATIPLVIVHDPNSSDPFEVFMFDEDATEEQMVRELAESLLGWDNDPEHDAFVAKVKTLDQLGRSDEASDYQFERQERHIKVRERSARKVIK